MQPLEVCFKALVIVVNGRVLRDFFEVVFIRLLRLFQTVEGGVDVGDDLLIEVRFDKVLINLLPCLLLQKFIAVFLFNGYFVVINDVFFVVSSKHSEHPFAIHLDIV